MPVVVSDYTWTQSPTTINIRVPLKGVPSAYVDLFTCDNYIKAHYQPFLFEVFLLHDIVNSKSKCYLHENAIQFDLVKLDNVEWERLERSLTKEEKLNFKKEVLTKCQDEAKMKFEEKVKQKNELERFSVRQAMDIDNQNNILMDNRRDVERNKAMQELEKWRISKQIEMSNKTTITELPCDEPPALESVHTKSIPRKSGLGNSLKPIISQKKVIKSEYVERKKEESRNRVLPPVRVTSQLEVNFSSREFPTPSRESQAEEEATWLKNMTEARRATGFASEDLRPEEQDPQWCKEKGDGFFRDGNFLGAISAYTHGIKLTDNKMPSLFANRAATHFALGNFNKCALDCSTALELMRPACEGNRVSRARCLARRAAALARLGFLSKAIDEMKAAAKLLPDDDKLKNDIQDMERAWEQNPDSD